MEFVKKKKQSVFIAHRNKIFLVAISLATLLLGIGYAQLTHQTLFINADADVEPIEDVIITSVTSSNISIPTYTSNSVNSTVTLDSSNPSDTASMTITVYNNSDVNQYFLGTTVDSGIGYTNPGIVYTITGLDEEELIEPGESKTFTVTFSYKDGQLQSSNTLTSFIQYNFSPLSSMTFTANNSPSATYTGAALTPSGVTVSTPSSGVEIKYGTTEGTYDSSSVPTFTEVGTHTVYYQIKAEGYLTERGSYTFTIEKATPVITLSSNTGTVVEGYTMTFTTTVSSGAISGNVAGTLSVSSGTTTVATVSPASSNITATPSGLATTITVTGVTNGTSTITVGFTPGDTSNYNTPTSVTYTANIVKSATIPTNTLCVNRTYTGVAQNLTSVTSGTGYTLSNYNQTNAGEYTITATLTEGYRWNDNYTGTKTFKCNLSKATPTITLSESSGSVDPNDSTSFIATVSSGTVATSVGVLSAVSSNTGYAIVSPTSSNITANTSGVATTEIVTGIAFGSSTITIGFTPTDTTNFNSAVSKTYSVVVETNYLMVVYSDDSSSAVLGNSNITRWDVEKIQTLASKSVPNNAIDSWDVSEAQNGSVMAYVLDEDNDGKYELYIGQNGEVRANPDGYGIFANYVNVTDIDLTNFNTSASTNMSYMFSECYNLTNLNLGNHFDTSNVTDMSYMFDYCSSLTTLDLGDYFDTSSVTVMSSMFGNCSSLTSLDLGDNFDTSSVTEMSSMFDYCSSLTTLDLGDNFDTSSVEAMVYMFAECSSLTSLDLGDKFDTSAVGTTYGMFINCSSLTSLDLGDKFDTSSVVVMRQMFSGCSSLTSLDLGDNFDTSSVENLGSLFSGCSSLTSLDLGEKFVTSSATRMDSVFANCTSLTTIYTSNDFDATKVVNSSYKSKLFSNDTLLVGGNGTVFSSSHVDSDYARIDAPGTPGYFTRIVYAEPVSGLVYNGTAQNLVEGNSPYDVYYSLNTPLDSTNYSSAGSTTIPTGTNAGSYTVYWYCPSKDTGDSLTNTISKATPVLTISEATGIIAVGNTVSFIATVSSGTTASAAGTLSAVSNDTSVATVSPASTNVIAIMSGVATTEAVLGVDLGNANITVSFTPLDTTNFNTPTSVMFRVKVFYSATIPTNSACKCSGMSTCRSSYSDFAYTGTLEQLTGSQQGTGFYFSGSSTGTQAGEYTVEAVLETNYIWSDNTRGRKSITCYLPKATPEITLSSTSGTITTGSTTTFTATVKSGASSGSVSGTLSASSGTTSVTTVSPTSTSITNANNSAGVSTTETVTGVAAGSSTITVSFTPSDTTNYNSAVNKTYAATVKTAATVPTNSLCKCTGISTCGTSYSSFAYTGSAQQLTTATSGTGYTLSGYSQTNVNTSGYLITATLASGYIWSDNTTGTKTFTCYLPKATPTITFSESSGVIAVGSTRTFTEKANIAGDFSNVSGTTSNVTITSGTSSYSGVAANTAKNVTMNGVAAGSSTITTTFTPTDATNYKTTTKTYAATVKTAATIPTNSYCKSGLTYTGSNQTITNGAGTGYTFSGNSVSAAGSHTVTATLSTGYVWTDNSTGTKSFSCSIGKATPTITLSASSGSVNTGSTKSFTATVKSGASSGSVSGTLSASSGTPAKATVSPTSKSISSANNSTGVATTETVTGVAVGSSVITVSFTPSDTTNYNNASSKTYTITVNAAGPTLAEKIIMDDQGASTYSDSLKTAIGNKTARDFSTTATTDEGLHRIADYASVSATSLNGYSYYFRGATPDNWVSFAGFYWRIVRINGDGSVRLIYSGTTSNHTASGIDGKTIQYSKSSDNAKYVGYTYDEGGTETDSKSKAYIDSWYVTNIKPSYEEYLSNEIFCNDRTYTTSGSYIYYGARTRLYTSNPAPSLGCTNQADRYTLKVSGGSSIQGISGAGNNKLDYPIGLLTADEASLAGAVYATNNTSYYLYTDESFWLLSPDIYSSSTSQVCYITFYGMIIRDNVSYGDHLRPVINLKPSVKWNSGNGSEGSPYTVKL